MSLLLLLMLLLFCFSCKTIIPKNKKIFARGFYYQYDKLNFNKIMNSSDTSWYSQIKPLANLLLQNPNWKIYIKTFLADSSTIDFFDKKRPDVIVVSKICQYLISQGCNPQNIITKAFNNCDDNNRIIYNGYFQRKYKRKNFNKDTFEWEIIRVD